jgi:hypothetical protein
MPLPSAGGAQAANAELLAEIKALRADNEQARADARAQAAAIAALQLRLVKLHERWDGDGMPEVRDVEVTV